MIDRAARAATICRRSSLECRWARRHQHSCSRTRKARIARWTSSSGRVRSPWSSTVRRTGDHTAAGSWSNCKPTSEDQAAGIQVVGISYDSVAVLKKFSDGHKITFPLLSDPGSKTIDAYHIRNEAAKGKAEGVPNPGTFIL